MRIGVVSDTHIPRRAPKVPGIVLSLFEGVDLILHAGDMERLDVLDELAAVAPVKAVCGNMDVFRNEGELPDRLIFEADGVRIGLIHGWGSAEGLEERIIENFSADKPRVIVYGHSHNALCEERNEVLLFNPGTPTDTVFAKYQSVGILTIDAVSVEGKIIRI